MEKKSFVKGAAILGVAGLLTQVLGAVFRIPLGNIIGDEGMGYYQTAYPIYVFLLVFSTNGAPAAISKMASERIAIGRADEAHRVFKLSFLLMFVMGILASGIFFFGAGPIVGALKNPGARLAMEAIAPALLFVPIMAVFRGYFQGMQEMLPTAVSQLTEQTVRVAVGLALAVALAAKGLEQAAAGATAGTSIGPVAGVLILIVIYMKKRKKIHGMWEDAEAVRAGNQCGEHQTAAGDSGSQATDAGVADAATGAGAGAAKGGQAEGPVAEAGHSGHREPAGSILKTLAYIAIPITIGVSILPIMNIGDVVIVMRRLQSVGFSENTANALYGQMTGMAGPVINIPMALALSMALSMVPAIAAAASTGDTEFLKLNVRLGLRTSTIIGVPCSLGLMALSEPIMRLLYPMQAESAVNAASCLFLLAIGIVFLCVAQTMAGTLQGLNRPGIAVWGLAAGFAVKCVSTYVLCGIPSLNVEGAAIGSTLGYITIGLVNFAAVRKMTGITFDMKLSVGRPMAAGLVMFAGVWLSYRGLASVVGGSLATVGAIGIGGMLYLVCLIKFGAVAESEIHMFPKGQALAKLFKKLHLM